MTDPVLHLVAGPNGAGKSTFYEEVPGPITGLPFINADQIAAKRWPGRELEMAYEASEMAARQRERALKARRSFATETVFSHPSKLDLLRAAREKGYRLTLHVILIPEELAVARVEQRVRAGGHAVPEEKIRARFSRLWMHLHQAIALCDETFVYDNSRAARPYRRVAEFSDGRPIRTPDWPPWTPDDLTSA
ncbi:MAG TPA: zeta toxin family protein [Acidimicrobiales bacterium]|nr:zeta toxin family protein [Acidimicrobiales bacterium]